MKKRLLALALALCMVLSLLPAVSAATPLTYKFEAVGNTGARITATGGTIYSVSVDDPTLASASLSGSTVTVTAQPGAVGVATVLLNYGGAEPREVAVPVGYTTFVFNGSSLTVLPGDCNNFEISGINDKDEEYLEGDATYPLTVDFDAEGHPVYTNTSNYKINVGIKKKGGTFVFRGTANDMTVTVKKEATGAANLLLCGLNLSSSFATPLTVKKGSSTSVTVTALAGHENTLSDAAYNNEDTYGSTNLLADSAVIKVKSDPTLYTTSAALTLNGKGTLNLNCATKNAIKTGEYATLTIEELTLNVNSAKNGISSDHLMTIRSGKVNVTSAADGIRTDPDAVDAANGKAGNIVIQGGKITVKAGTDCIQSAQDLTISGGSFDLTSCGGATDSSFNGNTSSGKGLKASFSSDESADTSKATNTIAISGGDFRINTPDDAIHSDAYINITGGTFEIESGDDGVHADTTLTLGESGGDNNKIKLNVLISYEGLEAGTINMYSGTYTVTSTDDGVNAAGGSDGSGNQPGGGGFNPGFPGGGGRPQPGQPGQPGGGSSSGSYSINLYGGNLWVNAEGDGLDANGNLNISGGNIVVWGQKTGADNEPLDYDGTFTLTGGTVFAAGGAGMGVATPASGAQSYISKTNQNVTAGKTIHIRNSSGTEVYSTIAIKNVSYIFYSAPGMSGGSVSSDSSASFSGAAPIDGVYTIHAVRNNAYVVGVANGSKDSGANVELQTYTDSAAQRFVIQSDGAGYFTIRNLNSGMYLDAANGSTSNGTNLWQYTYNGSDAQKWKIMQHEDGSYTLQLKSAAIVMDLTGGKVANGTNIEFWAYGKDINLRWTLRRCAVLNDGQYKLTQSANALGSEGSTDGSNVGVYAASSDTGDRWTVKALDNGYYSIISTSTGKSLDVNGASSANNTNIQLWTANSSNAQLWSAIPNTDGTWSFASACGSLYVTSNGSDVRANTYAGSSAQKWKLEEAAHVHEGKEVSRTEATCTAPGVVTYRCDGCGATYTETTPALGHSYGAPVNAGKTHTLTCTVCGDTLSESHSYVGGCCACGAEDPIAEWYVVTFVVGEGASVTTYNTQDTGDVTEVGATSAFARSSATGLKDISGDGQCNFSVSLQPGYRLVSVSGDANFKNMKAVDEATNLYRCTKITGNVVITIETVREGHNYVVTAQREADCENDGYVTYYCAHCGDSYTETTPALGHVVVTDAAVAATCEQSGLTEGSHCTRCGKVLTAQKTVDALGHSLIRETTATCVENGITTITCERCDLFMQLLAPAQGHDFSVVTDNGGDHTVSCSRCDESFKQSHSFVNGVCECGATETELTDPALIFEATTVSLEEKIIYTGVASSSVLSRYDSWYVEFRNLDACDDRMSNGMRSEGEAFGTKRQVFRFPIYVCQMTDRIEATIYGVKDGVTYRGQSVTRSVERFVLAMLPIMSEPMQAMSVNMLHYGAMMQKNFKYRTEHLANDELGIYEELVLHTIPEAKGGYSATSDGYDAVRLSRRALSIASVVELQYAFRLGTQSADEIYVEIVVDGVVHRLEGSDLIRTSSSCIAIFGDLLPTQGDSELKITVYAKDGTRLSETYTDALVFAVADYQNSNDENIRNAVNAMLNYYRLAKIAYTQ